MTNPKIAKASAWLSSAGVYPEYLLAKAVQKQIFMRVLLLASQSAAESLMIIVNDNFRISLFGTLQSTIYYVKSFF